MRLFGPMLFAVMALLGFWPALRAQAQSPTAMVCQFNSGPRASTAAFFQADHGPPVEAGTACTDNDGSNGRAIADDGTKVRTTICQFDSGPKAGFAFDLAGRGGTPLPPGAACSDGKDSSGKSIAVGIAIPTATLTNICKITFGPKIGTIFDVTSYNLPPTQIGSPCSDLDGNIGIGIAK